MNRDTFGHNLFPADSAAEMILTLAKSDQPGPFLISNPNSTSYVAITEYFNGNWWKVYWYHILRTEISFWFEQTRSIHCFCFEFWRFDLTEFAYNNSDVRATIRGQNHGTITVFRARAGSSCRLVPSRAAVGSIKRRHQSPWIWRKRASLHNLAKFRL